ncbi:MAG: hypothetical protein IPN39_00050 [Chitinophagaceae bacterium]|nr:hypothetical protein [Chitinophagaceae bacterium]
MEQTDNMQLVKKNNHYELVVLESAVFEDYENILNYLMKEMNLKDVEEIDDFDSRYQLFNYNEQIIVLYYSSFLGISIYFDDKTIDSGVQLKVLKEFWEVLKKANRFYRTIGYTKSVKKKHKKPLSNQRFLSHLSFTF